ncbi:MAG: HD-GYP domain-containing protein [Burkholderiales bacterium]
MNHIHGLLKSLFVMSAMVEARDPYTGGHLWRVSQFSRLLAERAGFAQADVARVALGGYLHDLGKIGVPDGLLNKPARLTPAEYEVIKTHPGVGCRVLADHPLAEKLRAAVLSHHETPDGKGYPHGFAGRDLHMDARIVGICDAFDAMTSPRPYRKGMPIPQALNIIHEQLGQQFDHALGREFIDLGENGVLDHVVGHSEPGVALQTCPMCGPTIVVAKDQRSRSQVYCRVCGGEAEFHRGGGMVGVTMTGKRGRPLDLEANFDNALIDSLVEESGRFVTLGAGRQGSLYRRIYDRLYKRLSLRR